MLTDPVDKAHTNQVAFKGFTADNSSDDSSDDERLSVSNWMQPNNWWTRWQSTDLDCIHLASSSPTGKRYAY